jgi:hypothetical protein
MVGVLFNDYEELVERGYVWYRVVAMPLEIGTLPIHAPLICAADVGCFGDWRLCDLGGIVPRRADLEDLDALIHDPVTDIELGADVRGRTCVLDVSPHSLVMAGCLEF